MFELARVFDRPAAGCLSLAEVLRGPLAVGFFGEVSAAERFPDWSLVGSSRAFAKLLLRDRDAFGIAMEPSSSRWLLPFRDTGASRSM